jgi:hypothetical protein
MDEAYCTHSGVYSMHMLVVQNLHDVKARWHQQVYINFEAGITSDHLIGPHLIQVWINGSQYLLFV